MRSLSECFFRRSHVAASKFVRLARFLANTCQKPLQNGRFLPLISAIQVATDPLECLEIHREIGLPVKILLIAVLLVLPANAWAQVKPSKSATRDVCAPIGKTANGQLVYGMACDAMPAPPPRAAVEVAPVSEPEIERSGIFGMSYTRKPPSQ